jgi:hypothetical protein
MTAVVPTKQVQVTPPNSGAVLVEVASGATAQLMPAPPSGFLVMTGFIRAKNLSAVSAATFLIQDGAGNLVGGNSALAASAQGNAIGGQFYSATAITVTVGGAGGPVQFSGAWCYVPIVSPGRKLVPFVANIGLAPVAVPQIVPPAGLASVVVGACQANNAYCGWGFNRDVASATLVWRITRSAVVWEGNEPGSQAANSRTFGVFGIIPAVLPGDTFEVHTVLAPGSPNTVWVGGCWQIVPLVS